MFPYKWRAKLAKRGGVLLNRQRISLKRFKADCELTASGIQEQIPLILEVILLAVENEDRQIEIAMRQNLVSVGGENVDTPQQNNPRRTKAQTRW